METLIELEDIKTVKNKTEDVRAASRKATRWLSNHHGEYEVILTNDLIFNILDEKHINYDPDNIICAAAYLC